VKMGNESLLQLSTGGFLGLGSDCEQSHTAEAKVIHSLVMAGCLRFINVVLVHPQRFQALETTTVIRATTTADGGSTVTNSKRETKFSGTYYPHHCSPRSCH